METMDASSTTEPTTSNLKEWGNAAVKKQKYDEAVLHYTHAIKRDPQNYVLYSNRSFAFLKLQQYALALEDANETIKLNGTWAKGYFRKAEIECATYHYLEAYDSYALALQYKPDDNNIYEGMQKTRRLMLRERKADEQIPWLGSGIGIVVGVIIVIADYLLTQTPTHPLLMAIVTIAISIAGYGIAKLYRAYVRNQRKSLLESADIGCGDAEESEEAEPENVKTARTTPKYTKSQARQRFKKGKL